MNKGKRMPVVGGQGYVPAEIEVYHYGRYFTVNGGGTGVIKDGQAIVDSIVYLIELSHEREISVHNFFRFRP